MPRSRISGERSFAVAELARFYGQDCTVGTGAAPHAVPWRLRGAHGGAAWAGDRPVSLNDAHVRLRTCSAGGPRARVHEMATEGKLADCALLRILLLTHSCQDR